MGGQPPGYTIGGTYRTLDNALGDRQLFGIEIGKKIFMRKITLRDSIFSKEGVTEIDDSASYLLNEDGSLSPRKEGRWIAMCWLSGKNIWAG